MSDSTKRLTIRWIPPRGNRRTDGLKVADDIARRRIVDEPTSSAEQNDVIEEVEDLRRGLVDSL